MNYNELKSKWGQRVEECVYWEISDGWIPILDEFLERTKEIPIKLFQVKQKFGGLRIYWDPLVDENGNSLLSVREPVDKITDELEKKANFICEYCSEEVSEEAKKKRTGYWNENLCLNCIKK